jgi:Domain of unknown function (DUF5658)
MTLKFRCARCGRVMAEDPDQADTAAKCPGCGSTQRAHATSRPGLGDSGNPGEAVEPPGSVYRLAAPPLEPFPTRTVGLRLLEPPIRQRSNVLWDLIHGSVLDTSRLQAPSLLLIGLSIADILITFRLLQTSHAYYESNPVAYWFFARWNMRGMVVFKFAAIAFAIAAGELIERRRPGLGRFVLWVGCMGATAVIWHGFRLYMGLPGLPIPGRS